MVELLDQVLSDTNITLLTDVNPNHGFKSINNNKIIFSPFSSKMEKYLENTDVAITGGGLTKYECAYNCIPNASLTQNFDQDAEAQTFANAGLTYYLGMAENLYLQKDNVVKKLNDFLSLNVRNTLFENVKKKFITDSTQNLVDAVLEN